MLIGAQRDPKMESSASIGLRARQRGEEIRLAPFQSQSRILTMHIVKWNRQFSRAKPTSGKFGRRSQCAGRDFAPFSTAFRVLADQTARFRAFHDTYDDHF